MLQHLTIRPERITVLENTMRVVLILIRHVRSRPRIIHKGEMPSVEVLQLIPPRLILRSASIAVTVTVLGEATSMAALKCQHMGTPSQYVHD